MMRLVTRELAAAMAVETAMAEAEWHAQHWARADEVTRAARRIPRVADERTRRLERMERVAWVLDRSIPIGRWRIGLDPILGLVPGAGDWLGAALSLYVLYEAARLGAPGGLLLRMVGNIFVDTALGAVPVLGDVFDFFWGANQRNLDLIRRREMSTWRPRSFAVVAIVVLAVAIVVIGSLVAAISWLLQTLLAAF